MPPWRLLAGSLALASALWWAFAPVELNGPGVDAFAKPQARRVALQDPRLIRARAMGTLGLFPSTMAAPGSAGAAASADQIVLKGSSISPGRKAALISVGGAKPQWLAADEPSQGLELVDVTPGGAVVRTTSGEELTLDLFPAAARDAQSGVKK
jgi:hypothetical protein